jgi:hypothetical protein
MDLMPCEVHSSILFADPAPEVPGDEEMYSVRCSVCGHNVALLPGVEYTIIGATQDEG